MNSQDEVIAVNSADEYARLFDEILSSLDGSIMLLQDMIKVREYRYDRNMLLAIKNSLQVVHHQGGQLAGDIHKILIRAEKQAKLQW